MKQYRDWTPLQQQVFEESLEVKSDGCLGSKFTVAARDQIFDAVLRVPGLVRPVAVPTLFMQSEAGVNRFDWQLQPYRKYLQTLQIQKIPGNHWAFLVEPDAFSAALLAFLDAQSGEM
jgi:haloacetate dehalogenase